MSKKFGQSRYYGGNPGVKYGVYQGLTAHGLQIPSSIRELTLEEFQDLVFYKQKEPKRSAFAKFMNKIESNEPTS